MTEGVCPTNDCRCTEPFITSYGNGLYAVGCSKCGGYVTWFVDHSEDSYLHAIDIWLEVTKELGTHDDRGTRIPEED